MDKTKGVSKNKMVYVGMTADIVHPGIINIINKAKEYGDVCIGLLTDKAVAQYKRLPYQNYDQRKSVIENIQGVYQVVPQEEWDYAANLIKYKPDIMVHGDDWRTGSELKYRNRAFELMEKWGGKIIEIPYTKGVSSSDLYLDILKIGTTPDIRRQGLKRLLDAKGFVRVLETHSPLSALIIEKLSVEKDEKPFEFDAMWSSSLTTSTLLGKPDIEAVDHASRLALVNHIFEVTTKPMIYDGDTGGQIEHMRFFLRSLESMGGSAVVLEDKEGLKKNSLLGNDVLQHQCSIEDFANKITAAKRIKVTDEFMVISRIESLILEKGMDDALKRAFAYVEAGSDGIMIHSRQKTPDEVFEFCKQFRKNVKDTPIVAIPSSYSSVYESELIEQGVNIVIYANQMLRSSFPAMEKVAKTILENSRAKEADALCMSINDILNLIPGTN